MGVHVFPQTVWPHWRVLMVTVKARCSIEVVSVAFGIFPLNFRRKWLLWHVHVHFDCGGSHETVAAARSSGIFPEHFYTKWLLWDRPCNPLVTLGLSDRSRCGAVLVFIVKEVFYRDLDKEVSYRELVQRSCTESSCRDLVQQSCQELSYRDLAKRSLIESLYRDLFKSLAKRPFVE